jgi:hypothetical protein
VVVFGLVDFGGMVTAERIAKFVAKRSYLGDKGLTKVVPAVAVRLLNPSQCHSVK